MQSIRSYLQHRFNPLHMYCRLLDYGLRQSIAHRVCSVYERFLYRASPLG